MKVRKIFLIFPNQLFKIKKQFQETKYVALIQDSIFFGSDTQWKQKFHCQKVIFHKATMDYYEEELKKEGLSVIYIKHKMRTRTEDNLNYLLEKGFNHFITYEAFDWSLEKRTKDFSIKNNIKLEIIKSEMFLTCKDISEEIITQK